MMVNHINTKDHMDWIDENSNDIFHFGIYPDKLNYNNIKFDILCLLCTITRKLMQYLRKFIVKQSQEINEHFLICY